MLNKIKTSFLRLTLLQRFMLAGLVILLAGMLGIGAWVGREIETGVIRRTGATTALYVDSFVAPLLQELGQSNELSPENITALSQLVQNTPMGRQIVAFKVWDTRGRLLYSTDAAAIGKSYPMQEHLLRARLGEVVSEISRLDEVENIDLSATYHRLLETYSPVWLSGTDQVIAVAEFYQRTDDLDGEIAVARRRSWLVVGLAILLIYLLLSGFVRRASDTISRQQAELGQKVVQLSGLLAQNRELHGRVRRAAASVALLNESTLRRIGAELHDGPVQDLSLTLLKLDALAGRIEDQAAGIPVPELLSQINGMESLLQNTLKEMRAISTGLSLPQLNELNLPETVARAVRTHERKTGTRVELEIESLPDQAALPLKITLYRLIQEALTNAFRHAGGAGQQVRVCGEGDQLLVKISDQGPGFDPQEAGAKSGRLGLSGMRERVESLGGLFELESQPGMGTRIQARLPSQLDGGGDG